MAVGDEDPQSPTVMVQSYLRGKGLQPTALNVHNALMAQSQGMNIIPGLDTERPPTTDPGTGQSGNVAGKIEAAPGAPSRSTTDTQGGGKEDTRPSIMPGNDSSSVGKQTSAQPDTSGGDSGLNINLGPAILGGLGAAALGAGGYGAWRYGMSGRGSPSAEFVGNAGDIPPSGRVTDVVQPDSAITGDRYAVLPPPDATGAAASPMDSAMQRAMLPGGAQPVNIPPYVSDPSSIINAGRGLPPGVTPTDAVVAGMPNLTTQPAQSRVGTAEMPPLASRGPRVPIRPELGPAGRLLVR